MVTLRHRFAALTGVVMLAATVVGVGAASAQTTPTYTPGTSTGPLCTGGPVNAGNVSIGQTVTFMLCGPFQPGATAAINVNGTAAGSKTVASNGTVTIVITINSATSGTVNDPVTVPVTCGSNTATATSGGVSQTGTFNLICGSTTKTSGLAFTGANVMKAVLAALLLIAIGGALVLAQRRRRSSHAL